MHHLKACFSNLLLVQCFHLYGPALILPPASLLMWKFSQIFRMGERFPESHLHLPESATGQVGEREIWAHVYKDIPCQKQQENPRSTGKGLRK